MLPGAAASTSRSRRTASSGSPHARLTCASRTATPSAACGSRSIRTRTPSACRALRAASLTLPMSRWARPAPVYAKAALSAWSPASALSSAGSNRRSASAGLPAARSAAALAISANERPQLSPLSVIAWTARSASCCADCDVAELGGRQRVDGAAHGDAPVLGERFGQRDQRPCRRPAVGQPALQHANERFGAGAPGQTAGVVLLPEQLDGMRRAPRRRRRNRRGWSLTRPDVPAPRRRPGRRPRCLASSSAWL